MFFTVFYRAAQSLSFAVPVSVVTALVGPLSVLGAAWLLYLEVHHALDDTGKELLDDVVLGRDFSMRSANAILPLAIVLSSRAGCSAKTTFAKAHDGRPLGYQSGRLVHYELGRDPPPVKGSSRTPAREIASTTQILFLLIDSAFFSIPLITSQPRTDRTPRVLGIVLFPVYSSLPQRPPALGDN
jgi:hypothetical protein